MVWAISQLSGQEATPPQSLSAQSTWPSPSSSTPFSQSSVAMKPPIQSAKRSTVVLAPYWEQVWSP